MIDGNILKQIFKSKIFSHQFFSFYIDVCDNVLYKMFVFLMMNHLLDKKNVEIWNKIDHDYLNNFNKIPTNNYEFEHDGQ